MVSIFKLLNFVLIIFMLMRNSQEAPLMANMIDVSVPFPSANIARHQSVRSRPLPVNISYNKILFYFIFGFSWST